MLTRMTARETRNGREQRDALGAEDEALRGEIKSANERVQAINRQRADRARAAAVCPDEEPEPAEPDSSDEATYGRDGDVFEDSDTED